MGPGPCEDLAKHVVWAIAVQHSLVFSGWESCSQYLLGLSTRRAVCVEETLLWTTGISPRWSKSTSRGSSVTGTDVVVGLIGDKLFPFAATLRAEVPAEVLSSCIPVGR